MHQLLAVGSFNFHVNPISLGAAFILTYSECLAAFRRPLVDDVEFLRWMLFEKISENELRLRFTVRLRAIIQCYIDRFIKEPGKLLCTAGFNCLLYLANDVPLAEYRCLDRKSGNPNNCREIPVYFHVE